ncbi:hypothetical protein P3T76_005193 [Phytophthora citrophthora]|uniref:Uncharacterized protein n=1 Tax=Phytophthora citrophthora TaxID=4793 RepID=A0AAD9GSB7_9STRA|nr:hypothetical protein P3T76_005193 [Phytophthora citrophthora]
MYMLGMATGTLTGESIANLTCCFFAFSYSFVNLVKARSGDQQLDRHFRLTWEAMQIVITVCVGSILLSVQRTPLVMIFSENAEVLRKTSTRGAKYCGLNDACVLFTYNMPSVVAIISVLLGFIALVTSFLVKKLSPKVKNAVRSARMSLAGTYTSESTRDLAAKVAAFGGKNQDSTDHLTTFEKNCIGAPFKKLFRDCDDMAYVMYNGKRCIAVEALLLTRYLYYGEHIYQVSAVMLLLLARLIPRKMLRNFNMLLLRWHVDESEGTLSHAKSCTWYTASKENHKLAGPTPLA